MRSRSGTLVLVGLALAGSPRAAEFDRDAPAEVVPANLAAPECRSCHRDVKFSDVRATHWVRSSPERPLPPNATQGGEESRTTLYVCRAPYAGGVHPGKWLSGHCNIGFDGREIVLDDYDVLTSGAGWWRSSASPPCCGGRLIGGWEHGGFLFICRGEVRDGGLFGTGFLAATHGVHPGKIVSGRCNVGYGGKEYELKEFDELWMWTAETGDTPNIAINPPPPPSAEAPPRATATATSAGQVRDSYSNTTGKWLNIWSIDLPKTQAFMDCRAQVKRGTLAPGALMVFDFPPDKTKKRWGLITEGDDPCGSNVFYTVMVPN